MFEWLQLKRHIDEVPTGKVFVILNDAEKKRFKFKDEDKLNIIYNNKKRTVYLFESKDELDANLIQN